MNMIVERIPVHKHFLVIDSPIPFTLRANNGTDEVYRMAGAWRIDLYTILTEKYFKQYPVFVLEMVYDEDLLQPGETIQVRQSDIDFGSGIAGVNGQDVRVTNFDDLKKKYIVKTYSDFSTFNEFAEYLLENDLLITLEDNNNFAQYFLNLDKIFWLEFFQPSFDSGGNVYINNHTNMYLHTSSNTYYGYCSYIDFSLSKPSTWSASCEFMLNQKNTSLFNSWNTSFTISSSLTSLKIIHT